MGNDRDLIVYGKNPIYELLKANRRKIYEVFFAGDERKWQETKIFNLLKQKGIKTTQKDANYLNLLSLDGVHQNIVAKVGPYETVGLQNLLDLKNERSLVLILDSIQDPQNFGTICRSALAFGVKYIVMPKDRSVKISASVMKASAGALEHLNIVYVTNLVRAMKELKDNGYWLYGALLADDTLELNKADPAHKSAIVMGSEGKGIRRLVSENCDIKIKIPMAGGFDSLNVAQATTVMLYDFSNKMGIVDNK